MKKLQERLVTNLRELAATRQIPLTHLPDRAGVSRSHFWDVLAGRKSPTLKWLEQIAAALEVDPVALLAAPHAQAAAGKRGRAPRRRRA